MRIGGREAARGMVANAPVVATGATGFAVFLEHLLDGRLRWEPWQGLWRLSLVLLLLVAARALGRKLAARFDGLAFTSWWDPASEPDGALKWDELLALVRPERDPIENVGVARGCVMMRCSAIMAIVAVIGVACAWPIAEWLADPKIPEVLLRSGSNRVLLDGIVNASQNLTAFLALVAAAASIRFASLQLRSKVRADNRQEWLANARTLLGQVVAFARQQADERHGWGGRRRARSIASQLDPLRLRFELMLNPREKDHRLLMHLLRQLAFLGETERAEKADGGAFIVVLKRHCDRSDASSLPQASALGAYESKWKTIVECTDPAELTTYIMRLGHVVLKREWERVKATR